MVRLTSLLFSVLPASYLTASAVPVSDDASRRDGGHGNIHTRIYGGTLIGPDEFLSLVQFRTLGNGLCGGTLVSKNLVVTSASCVIDEYAPKILVLLGTHDTSKGGSYSNATRIIVNPDYKLRADGTSDGDIALLQLSHNFQETSKIRYAKLPAQGSSPVAGDPGVVAGWGRLKDVSMPNSAYKTSVPFVSTEDCEARSGEPSITDKQICAGGLRDDHVFCTGDFGGPIVNNRNGNFVGIASETISSPAYPLCGGPSPQIYTRVGYYVDWIKSYM